jgi:hypothetical protein
MATLSEQTEKMERVLETAGREYGKHSGPSSDERERATFARDLRTAALRAAAPRARHWRCLDRSHSTSGDT